MRKEIINVVILIFGTMILSSCGFGSTKGSSGISSSTLNYTVENVKIEKRYPNAWGVTGMIRNNESRSIKGAAKIKFLNSRGDAVHNNRTSVNGNDPLSPGQAGSFEYFVEPSTFDDVKDFDIEFYEK